jgi:uncharacterized membrane protein YqgA involved in biofilm formation
VFSVEGCVFGFGEEFVAVKAFVDLVVCAVFAVFYGVFVFFFLVVCAFWVLAWWSVCVFWACHAIIFIPDFPNLSGVFCLSVCFLVVFVIRGVLWFI